MNDEQMQPLLEVWLRDREVPRPKLEAGVAKVMAELPRTRQQGRWWPLLVSDHLAPTPQTIRRQPARGSTMFSALKFIAASVIVALFGGYLMVGVLTTQPSEDQFSAAVSASPTVEATSEPTEEPTTSVRTDILPGVELTVEEVEPGVFHVVNDGVRNLVLGGNTDIVAGDDDGVWLLRKNQFLRLGSEAGHAWPQKGGRYDGGFEVTPDGRVWVIQGLGEEAWNGPVLSFDGVRWTRTESLYKVVNDIAVAPDGTLWASWSDEGPQMHYLGPSGWQPFDDPTSVGRLYVGRLYPIDSGVLYATDCGWGCQALRYVDGTWLTLTRWLGAFDVAPDGTVWLLGRLAPSAYSRPYVDGRPTIEDPYSVANAGDVLARFTGREWASWSPEELADMGLGISLEADTLLPSTFMAAPDGSLWASLWQRGPDGDEPPAHGLWTPDQRGDRDRYDPQCDGLVRFDGETADRFLSGRCITMDIAADGSVWVLADREEGKNLYVITPEAVAASN